MTPWGIELATFRLVAQCLNQLRYSMPPFFEGTSIIHQDNGNDHGQKMAGRATARIKIIIHQHTDKIQFFVEEKPLELHRSLFNFKCNMYNLYLRNPEAERNALYLPARSPQCVWHFSKSSKTTHLTMHCNMKTWTRESTVIPRQIGAQDGRGNGVLEESAWRRGSWSVPLAKYHSDD